MTSVSDSLQMVLTHINLMLAYIFIKRVHHRLFLELGTDDLLLVLVHALKVMQLRIADLLGHGVLVSVLEELAGITVVFVQFDSILGFYPCECLEVLFLLHFATFLFNSSVSDLILSHEILSRDTSVATELT